MKQLIVAKPDNPLDFIINTLAQIQRKSLPFFETPLARRVFLIGEPETCKKEIAQSTAELCGDWRHISVSDVLRHEEAKKTEVGKRINECFEEGKLVDDDIVIKLVKAEIEKCESEYKSWIISGFPQTKVQALSLQKLKIVPDKFIYLSNGDLNAYDINLNAVRDSFKQFIYDHVVTGDLNYDCHVLKTMLELRYKSEAPRRPPRIIILGPPGSGRSYQSMALAQRFGLVYISPK